MRFLADKTKHFNQSNRNHHFLIFLVDGSELRGSFPTALVSGTKSQSCTQTCVSNCNGKVGKGFGVIMMQMLILGMKMVTRRNRPMEEEDGVQSKAADEVRQWLHQNWCFHIPGREFKLLSLFLYGPWWYIFSFKENSTAKYRPDDDDHNTPKSFVLWRKKVPHKDEGHGPSWRGGGGRENTRFHKQVLHIEYKILLHIKDDMRLNS